MTGLTLAMSRTCRLLNRQKGGGLAPPSSFMPNMLRQFRRVRFNPRPPSSCRWFRRHFFRHPEAGPAADWAEASGLCLMCYSR